MTHNGVSLDLPCHDILIKTRGHSSLRRMQCPFSIRYEVLPDVNCQLRGFDDDVDVFSQMISPIHGFSIFRSTDQIVHHLHKTFHCDKDKLTPTLVGTLTFSLNLSNCKFVCLCSFIFCIILMLNNHIYHFK